MTENMGNYKGWKKEYLKDFYWEDFLCETKKLAEKLPNGDKDRLKKLAELAYVANDDLEDKFMFWYSFGATIITKEISGLPIDIFVSQNEDYLYRTGKYKVFFKISNDEESVDLGVVENGKYYQKEFDVQEISDEIVNSIIRFTFNNDYLLKNYVFGHYNTELMIPGCEFADIEKINKQFVAVRDILTMEERFCIDYKPSKDLRIKELQVEFNYNYLSRMHKLYFRELRFGQFLCIFTNWYDKKYNKDYFYTNDIEMTYAIDEFIKEMIKTKS